jgi:hypothetical protein
MTDPMTTAGDLIRRSGANATERLAVGTDGQVLTVVSGLPAWAAAAGGGGAAADAVPGFPASRIQYSGGLRGDTTTGNSTAAANRAYLLPIPWPTAGKTIASLSISVGANTPGVTVRLGVYQLGDDGLPDGAPLSDAGTIDASTLGFKTISGLSVAPDVGWVGLVLIPSAAVSLGRLAGSGMSPYGVASVGNTSQAWMAYDDLADNTVVPATFAVDGYEAGLGPWQWWIGF